MAEKLVLQVKDILSVIVIIGYIEVIYEAKPIVAKLMRSGLLISKGMLDEFL